MQLKKPIFWNKKGFLSILLYPLTIITYFFNLTKKQLKKKKFKIKTICIGNIYIGGTGKTPLSIKINKILKKKYKTVFVKKKYLNQIDEQKLLRNNGKLICKSTRFISLKHAENEGFELAILDDGLQEKKFDYDISIACFNTSSGVGNGFLLPAGPLRENLSALKNYHAVFLIGEKNNKKLIQFLKKTNKNTKLFEGKYRPENLKKFNRNKDYLAFSGLGNPKEFENTLKKYKFKVKEKLIFPDHYNFSNSEINKIKKKAEINKLVIITTEKDYLKLNKKNKKNINFLKIKIEIKNLGKFSKFLKEKL